MSDDALKQLTSNNAMSAVGAFGSGASQVSNFTARGSADKFNAGVAADNASIAGETGATNTVTDVIKNNLALGKQRAAFGQANPGGASVGTAATAVGQSDMFGDLQAMQDNYKATVARFSATNQEAADNYGAKVADNNAKEGMLSTLLNTTRAFNYGTNGGGF